MNLEPIITAIITGLTSITVTVLTVVVKDFLDRRKIEREHEKSETITEEDMSNLVLIQDWLDGIREKYDFDRSAIFQFHNGGKFFQGKSMKKFSMTFESVAPGYEKIKRNQQNVLASEYPQWISNMLNKKCFSSLTSEMSEKDRLELESFGIQQTITVPIYCIKGHLVGFIVGYNISKVDDTIRHRFPSLVEDAKWISGYVV